MGVELDRVRLAVAAGRLAWRAHALRRMLERGISRDHVVAVLRSGEVIEDYPDDQPYPSALVLGFADDRPVHGVIALDAVGSDAYMITAYEPDADRFDADWRRRINNRH